MIVKGAKHSLAAPIKVEEPVAAPAKKSRKEKKAAPIEVQPEITVEIMEVEETPTIVEDEE